MDSGEELYHLVGCGLQETQARVYLTLARLGETPAGQLARATHVPRNRIYEVLEGLQLEGLVEAKVGTKTRVYRALPLGPFLDERRERLRTRLERVEQAAAVADALTRAMPAGMGAHPTIRVLEGRRRINQEVRALLQRASSTVLVGATPMSFPRVAHLLRPRLEDMDGIELTLHLPRQTRELIAPDDPLLSHVRWIDVSLGTLNFVRDAAEAIRVQPLPDTPHLTEGADFAVHAVNPAFAADCMALLHHAAVRSR